MTWESQPTVEFDAWFDSLSPADQEHVIAAVTYLEQEGPTARMPLSRPIEQSTNCDMKELRPASTGRSEIRILYAFEHRRTALLLLGGDNAGKWTSWYDENIPKADRFFAVHVEETRRKEQEQSAKPAQAKATKKATKKSTKKSTRQGRRKR